MIEKVKEFKSGVCIETKRRSGRIKNRVKRAAMVIGQVWEIGKRKYGKTGEEGYGCSIT